MRLSTLLLLLAVLAAFAAIASIRERRRAAARYASGERVRVKPHYHWAKGATGTVQQPPPPVAALASDWRGPSRSVRGVGRVLTLYWVNFDEPQRDAEGDGPYAGGEIDEDYLERERR